MNQEPLISVLVPIYNGEKYLPNLLESLKNQTYKNLEFILVDDFSTDSSIEKIESLTTEDSRFKLIKRDTKGGRAISGIVHGINYCSGEYFFYLSQDDFIDLDCIEKCVTKALKTKADVVVSNMVFYYENDKSKTKKKGKFPTLGNYYQVISGKKAFYSSLKWYIGAPTLRKMNIVKSFEMNDTYFNNDEYYARQTYLKANKVVFVDTNFYYRQDNQDAITKSVKYFSFDILYNDIRLAKLLIDYKYPKRLIDKRIKELLISYNVWVNLYNNSMKKQFNIEQQEYVVKILNKSKVLLDEILNKENLFFSKLYLKFHKLEEIKDE